MHNRDGYVKIAARLLVLITAIIRLYPLGQKAQDGIGGRLVTMQNAKMQRVKATFSPHLTGQ